VCVRACYGRRGRCAPPWKAVRARVCVCARYTERAECVRRVCVCVCTVNSVYRVHDLRVLLLLSMNEWLLYLSLMWRPLRRNRRRAVFWRHYFNTRVRGFHVWYDARTENDENRTLHETLRGFKSCASIRMYISWTRCVTPRVLIKIAFAIFISSLRIAYRREEGGRMLSSLIA